MSTILPAILPLAPFAAARAAQLVLDTFDDCVAQEYAEDGREAFRRFAAEEALRFRLEIGGVAFGAFDGPDLLGVLEMRGATHIALLFVEPSHHRRGVARALVDRAIQLALERMPEASSLTVNSSPYALEAYRRMGFVATGPEHEEQGVRSTPMALPLARPLVGGARA